MSGATSRRKGHSLERFLAQLFRDLGWRDAMTSRAGDRSKDNACIDLLHTDPFNVQAKYTQAINMHTELSKMPQKDTNYNVVVHKRKNKGTVVAMSLDDFTEILGMLKRDVL